jgi:tricorn protease
MMKRIFGVGLVFLWLAAGLRAQDAKPLLLQQPTLSKTQICFVFAGDLWTVAREGGAAQRLTAGVGTETRPVFSPDGNWIAFAGDYDGNTDLYIVAATGGTPRRATWHPAPDVPEAWSPDGKQLLFRSPRNSYGPFNRLFTVAAEGGPETEIPLPQGADASYSPDGTRLAYVPVSRAFTVWKRYRGGRTTPIWLANLSDSAIEKVPHENANDFNPLWVGDKVYFLSDRTGAVSLWAYETKTKRVREALKNTGLDFKSAQAGPGALAIEQFGAIHLFDTNTGAAKKIDISVSGDMPGLRPRYERVAARLTSANLSPTGARAVFEARGEIVTFPAEKGDARDLTNTSGVAERDPAWSPDGRWIAYFSDESGEYALHLRNQTGQGEVKKIGLGNPPSYFYSPTWSPDSKKIAFTDKRLNLWYVDLEKGAPVKVDTNTYENPFRVMDPDWSPDSRWLVYTKQLKNRLCAVFVYSVEEAKTRQLSDGLSDARYAVFDKGGKHVFFTASTNNAPTTGWLDMSGFPFQVTRSAYVIVLGKDDPSPLAPESDEEKVEEEKKPEAAAGGSGSPQGPPAGATPPKGGTTNEKKPAPVKIDFEGIDQRILSLPLPARNFVGLAVGKPGTLFLVEAPAPSPDATGATVYKFDVAKRKTDKVLEGVQNFIVSANGEKMMYQQGPRWFIVSAVLPFRPGEGAVNTDTLEVRVDPMAEWRQIYREIWRIQRDFLYDPGAHGLNLAAAEKRYQMYLDGVMHRADLNYLFQEMLGNVVLGHHNVGGGDLPQARQIPGGLLGADYAVDGGRYRFAKIYNGENWNPQLRAPLTQPGVNVKPGEYLIAVNGREVKSSDNLYQFFEATSGKQVKLRVGAKADGSDAREVVVVPVANEQALRNLDWIEGNRRKAYELSGGRVGYVYLPNTAGAGYTNFNRYYYAQQDREAMVVDDRYNGGGSAADYIIDAMRRQLMNYWATREGEDFTTSASGIYGPKAMIINENSSSGGDAIAYYFRFAKLGPLIGKRTWGGLVGIYDYPTLLDGGNVSAPRVAFKNTAGEFDVENKGVAPDIEVELDPAAWRQGRDLQLEKAVQTVLDALQKTPSQKPPKPVYPNYHKP